jgi:hypothetical protein
MWKRYLRWSAERGNSGRREEEGNEVGEAWEAGLVSN